MSSNDRKRRAVQGLVLATLAWGVLGAGSDSTRQEPRADETTEVETYAPADSVTSEGTTQFGDPEVTWEEGAEAARPESARPSPTPIQPPDMEPGMKETAKVPGNRLRAMIDAIPPDRDYSGVFPDLVAVSQEAFPALEELYLDPSARWQSRWIAAMVLGRLEQAEARRVLERGLGDPLFLVRMSSIVALGNRNDPDAAPLIRKALEDKAMVVRSAAATALGRLQDRKAVPLLSEELFNRRNFHRGQGLWVRKHLLAALSAIGSEEAIPAVVRVLSDSDPSLRLEACRVMARLVPEAPPATLAVEEGCASRWIEWARVQDSPTPTEPPAPITSPSPAA